MAVRKRKNEKSKSETKNDDKSEIDQQVQKSSSKLSIICLVFALISGLFVIKVQFDIASNLHLSQDSNFKSGPAIVTTWKGVSRDWAESWIKYHAAVGFTRLFIFWDDPKFDRETIDYLKSEPLYSWVVDHYEPDEDYKQKYWRPNATSEDFEQRTLPAYGVHADTEITARQSLYAVRAAQIGLAEGVTWLLHIDADELFYDSNAEELDGSAAKVFESLSKKEFTHASFFNDEILPESASYTDKKQLKTPFHQRTLFKRNTAVTFDNTQRGMQNEWKSQKGVNFFMGYLCGKGAINLPEYAKRNPGRSVVPQHVVRFASDDRNLALVTELQNKKEYVHFEVPIYAYQSASYFYGSRILHYINSDLESARAKFMFREKFDTKIFDKNLATEEKRELYKLWEDKWTLEEGMPSDQYYNAMWKAVQAEKETGGKQAEDFYIKSSVITDKRQKNRFLQSGIIYRNEKIRDYMNKITGEINSAGINAPTKLKQYNSHRSNQKSDKFYSCARGPHYKCDHKDCCFHLRTPMFTFEKRLVGYIRYAAFEWWKQGLTWPPRN